MIIYFTRIIYLNYPYFILLTCPLSRSTRSVFTFVLLPIAMFILCDRGSWLYRGLWSVPYAKMELTRFLWLLLVQKKILVSYRTHCSIILKRDVYRLHWYLLIPRFSIHSVTISRTSSWKVVHCVAELSNPTISSNSWLFYEHLHCLNYYFSLSSGYLFFFLRSCIRRFVLNCGRHPHFFCLLRFTGQPKTHSLFRKRKRVHDLAPARTFRYQMHPVLSWSVS